MTSAADAPSKDSGPVLVWFRRDLRLADNPALHAAERTGRPVVPVFVLEDEPPSRPFGAASLWWLDKSLAALGEALEKLGSRLVLRRGDPLAVLPALAREVGAELVCWNRSFEPLVERRDEELSDLLHHHDVKVGVGNALLLQAPWKVRSGSDAPYKVFTPYWRMAQGQVGEIELRPAPKRLCAPNAWPDSDRLPDWKLHPRDPDWSTGFADWTPGEAGAQAQLERFTAEGLATYAEARDRPAVEGSSRLSPHLAWGEIGPRQVLAAVKAHPRLKTAGDKFLAEIGWREFNYHLLDQAPQLATRNFRRDLDALDWRRAEVALLAWKKGETGYPLVDAGMRQLWATGWMHNRVRMVTASFLVKHLLVDWREGERWFWDCLVDADPANNPGNWQWSAGVGADAQPFFRIFNPMAQGEKFDPDGSYVRRWAPELDQLETRYLHAPWTAPPEALRAAGIRLGETYPKPIVDHAEARARALEALKAAKAEAVD
jgi:deoxyribodipyrimidine photo-lyase